jgi:hypothetical protein
MLSQDGRMSKDLEKNMNGCDQILGSKSSKISKLEVDYVIF